MTWTSDFRLAKAVFHPDGSTAATIEGIQSGGIEANPDIRQEVAAGTIFAKTLSLQNLSPVGDLTVLNVEAAINALGLEGACITSATNPGLTMEFERRDCKDAASGSVHLKYTIGTGVITPTSLTVDHRGDASLSYQINAAYDGTNNPVVISDQQAAPTLTAAADKTFTMDRMFIGSSYEIEGKRNISIEFNPSVNSEGADSDPFDSVQSLSSMLHRVKVSGVDPRWVRADVTPLNASGVITDIKTGTALSATPLTMYLKDRDQLSTATAHIRLEMRGLVLPNTIIKGNATNPSECSFEMALKLDGVNSPIVTATGVAIP